LIQAGECHRHGRGKLPRFVKGLEDAMSAFLSLSWFAVARVRRWLATGGEGLARLRRSLKNRRAASSLAGLDDHMLADIGLTRSDLRDAYSEPLWHDPTDVLAGRAAERRLRRRRSALVRTDDEPQMPWLICESVTCR
jgi:uncharacterized protein YjiS (DUF1127 family)